MMPTLEQLALNTIKMSFFKIGMMHECILSSLQKKERKKTMKFFTDALLAR
jgi:hypothetical protein